MVRRIGGDKITCSHLQFFNTMLKQSMYGTVSVCMKQKGTAFLRRAEQGSFISYKACIR
jgi:hypothetical protein